MTQLSNIPAETFDLLQQVEAMLSPVYLVGGAVRDIQRGKTPQDYDFSTPLLPDDIEAAVRRAGKKTYIGGKRFGTVGCKIAGRIIEVTTFRTETYTSGSRKPRVAFIDDLTHDLSRRDFTINAMALRTDGRLVDPFGGMTDLAEGRIRTVNKAYDRYNEDPLRMLRAARFAAQLNFNVAADAEDQAVKKAHKILEISKERWVQELDKLLVSDRPDVGLEFLARTRLLHYMLPELAVQIGFDQDSPYHELDLWQHSLRTVRLTAPDPVLRWAALLHDIGKPYVQKKNQRGYSNYTYHDKVGAEFIQKIGSYLKWSKERTTAVHQLVLNHLEPDSPLTAADSSARFHPQH